MSLSRLILISLPKAQDFKIRSKLLIIVYLNFMRPTPTFDPRIQPVGVYIGGPPNRYPTPMMQQNMPIQQGYAQMPMINQPAQPAGYQIHIPQNQVPAQYINDPARAPRQ